MSDALDLDALAREFMVDREWADGADPEYAVICLRDLLARAVEAEREACAKRIAHTSSDDSDHEIWQRGYSAAVDDGVAAIRARGAKPGEGEK